MRSFLISNACGFSANHKMFAPLKLWKFGFYCERARPEVGGTKSRHDAGDHPVSGNSTINDA